ncbi:enoyl-CoA hydratase [Rhodoferax sediminis]|uniref:Enoyl-CoA hydratase n=1 Tax=Rhodoferax sediminis TaxID=2509614 RepID=A0A515DDS9_9BURK|nr:enoyl-CoA hydratase [Rhodoferax sediminis]QDL38564.1 enoyl-CoA hydratase [Rhodoferax sediminis]
MEIGKTLEDTMCVVDRHADGKLLAGRIDRIGVVLFNQPEKRNALNLAMWNGVCDVLDAFAADGEVRAVVYAGAGGEAFASGADISEFASKRNSADANLEYTRITGRGRDKMRDFPKPTLACVQGYCLGGGLNVALQADLRVASRDSVFGIPAARMGIAYGIEPMEKLVSLVGPARAHLLLYTARRFTGEEALAMGLVEVLAAEDVVTETLKLAAAIAENAPLSLQASRFAIQQVLKPPAERNHDHMAELTRRCMDSADYREGRAAFAEKRKPRFTGA